MKALLVPSLLLGLAASATLWLASERCMARFFVGDFTDSSGECGNTRVFHLHEPTEESERRARRGDRIHERITALPGIPVVWTRCEILRDGAVTDRFSVGALPYFGTLAAAALVPLLACLVRSRKSPG